MAQLKRFIMELLSLLHLSVLCFLTAELEGVDSPINQYCRLCELMLKVFFGGLCSQAKLKYNAVVAISL